MNKEDFIQNRVVNQQKWYSKEASRLKKQYTVIKIATISIAAMIPFVTSIIDNHSLIEHTVALMAVVIVVLEGLSSFFKHQEKWIEYRSTSESLKRELSFYTYGINPYEDSDASFKLFVINIEGILSGQNQNWKDLMSKSPKPEEQAKVEG